MFSGAYTVLYDYHLETELHESMILYRIIPIHFIASSHTTALGYNVQAQIVGDVLKRTLHRDVQIQPNGETSAPHVQHIQHTTHFFLLDFTHIP